MRSLSLTKGRQLLGDEQRIKWAPLNLGCEQRSTTFYNIRLTLEDV